MREHVDQVQNRFFMRLVVTDGGDVYSLDEKLRKVLPADPSININPVPEKRIVVMVTKEYHCLADILIRNYYGTLGAKVLAVIGNHIVLRDICNRVEIPFYAGSHEQLTKEKFEKEITAIIDECNPDYVVLDKFMRILSPDLVANFPSMIININ